MRVVGANKIAQHLRAAGGAQAFGDKHILMRKRNAGQRAGLAGGAGGVGGIGGGQRAVVVDGDEGIELRIEGVDAGQSSRG